MNLVKMPLALILLFSGIIIIIYTLYSSYGIFTAKNPAPEIFKVEQKTTLQKGGSQDTQAQLQDMLQEQLKGLLPTGSIPTLLNMFSWSIFAGISILAGTQISSLGIKLLK